MASGLRWQDWTHRAIACPKEWPFHTRIVLDGQEWVCLDRGGAIKFVPDTKYGKVAWVDFLEPQGRYPHGKILIARIIWPIPEKPERP